MGLLAAPIGPTSSTDPASVAAGFLSRELAAGGNHLSQTFGGTAYADYGLTLDAVIALDSAGAGQTEASAATAYVASHVNEYIGPASGDTELYAGALGKSLVAAEAQGVDPRAFGGVNLVASLQSLEQPTGQFKDMSTYGDYSNTIGQSLDIIGLLRAGAGPNPAALSFLASQQCPDGGFSLSFGASPCVSDPDATSYAAQALLAVSGSGDAAAGKALGYLTAQQGTDGGVGGSAPTVAANANSTGLAGAAFAAGGRTAQAKAAAAFVTSLQYGCAFATALRGGIAYDAAALASHRTAPTATDQDRRGTAQAILVLAGTPLSLVTATGADANAPTLTCATTPPTSSSTTSSSSTSSSSSSTSTHLGASGTMTTPTASTATGSLAYTGSEVWPIGLVALVLVLVGAGALLGSRRRVGAHA